MNVNSDHLKDVDLSFIRGQRGSVLLQVDNFRFVRNRQTGTKTYWICAKKVSLIHEWNVLEPIINNNS